MRGRISSALTLLHWGGGQLTGVHAIRAKEGDFLPDPGLDTNHTQKPVSRERSFIKQGREDLFRRSTGKPMQAPGHSPRWSIIFVIVFLVVDESMIDDR